MARAVDRNAPPSARTSPLPDTRALTQPLPRQHVYRKAAASARALLTALRCRQVARVAGAPGPHRGVPAAGQHHGLHAQRPRRAALPDRPVLVSSEGRQGEGRKEDRERREKGRERERGRAREMEGRKASERDETDREG
eukprot:578754-Rhodomonas_salina.1